MSKIDPSDEGQMKHLADIVKKELFTVELDAPVLDVVKAMADKNIGSALIRDKDGKIVGIFTERDLLKKVVPLGLSVRRTKIQQVMSSPLITVPLDTRATVALKTMMERKIRHLLVTNPAGKVVGMVGMRDVLEYIVHSLAVSNKFLREKIGPLEGIAD